MMEYTIGMTAAFSKTVTESDVYTFAGVCGDFNSAHVNVVEAEKNRFGKRVVHGALVNAFISTVLGTKLPGEGTIYVSQKSKFVKPVYINDTITASVELFEIDGNKGKLKTIVKNQNGDVVLEGEAKVILPI